MKITFLLPSILVFLLSSCLGGGGSGGVGGGGSGVGSPVSASFMPISNTVPRNTPLRPRENAVPGKSILKSVAFWGPVETPNPLEVSPRIDVTEEGGVTFVGVPKKGAIIFSEGKYGAGELHCSAEDYSIFNNHKWQVKYSLVEAEVIENKGNIIIKSDDKIGSRRIFAKVDNRGELWDHYGTDFTGSIENQDTGTIVFNQSIIRGEIKNRGSILMRGKNEVDDIENEGIFALSFAFIDKKSLKTLKMDAKLENKKYVKIPPELFCTSPSEVINGPKGSFTAHFGAAMLNINLINRGVMELAAPIQVRSFLQEGDKAMLTVILSESTDSKVAYIQASEDIIFKDGRIQFSYVGQSNIPANTSYKIFSGKSVVFLRTKADQTQELLSIDELDIEYLLHDSIQKGMIKLEATEDGGNLVFLEEVIGEAQLQAARIVAEGKRKKERSKQARKVTFSGLGRGVLFSKDHTDACFNGESFFQPYESTLKISDEVSFVQRQSMVGQDYTFTAMNYTNAQSLWGLYLGYGNGEVNVTDAGMYSFHTWGRLRLLSNLHMSQAHRQTYEGCQELYAVKARNEIALPFKLQELKITPKCIGGWNKAVSFENKDKMDHPTSGFAGMELDLSSSFLWNTQRLEVLARFTLVAGDVYQKDEGQGDMGELKLSLKAQVCEKMSYYGQINWRSQGLDCVEMGLNFTF